MITDATVQQAGNIRMLRFDRIWRSFLKRRMTSWKILRDTKNGLPDYFAPITH